MTGMSGKRRVFIISKDYEKIMSYVINEIKRGVTMHEIIGGFSHEKSMQLEIILTGDDLQKLMAYLGDERIESFVTTDTVNEVYGLWNRRSKRH